MLKVLVFHCLIIFITKLAVVSSFSDQICDEQLFEFAEAFAAKKLWSLRREFVNKWNEVESFYFSLVIDSWGKIESGYFIGKKISAGRFEECLNFTEPTEVSGIIEGQYCLVKWIASTNSSLLSGFNVWDLTFLKSVNWFEDFANFLEQNLTIFRMEFVCRQRVRQ